VPLDPVRELDCAVGDQAFFKLLDVDLIVMLDQDYGHFQQPLDPNRQTVEHFENINRLVQELEVMERLYAVVDECPGNIELRAQGKILPPFVWFHAGVLRCARSSVSAYRTRSGADFKAVV